MFSRHAETPPWVFAGPRGSAADFALDKPLQIEAALAAGMNVPRTSIAYAPNDVLTRAKELPLVLRPARAVASSADRLRRGRSRICGTEKELATALAEWAGSDPLLVQPYIRGTGEGVFGLATSDGIRAWSAHRRLRMMNPHGSGASACQSQSVAEQIRGQVEYLVCQVKWRGLFMVEVWMTRRASLVCGIQRPGVGQHGTRPSSESGIPAWAAKLALAQDFVTSDPRPSVSGAAVLRETSCILFLVRGLNRPHWLTGLLFGKQPTRSPERDYHNWRRSDQRYSGRISLLASRGMRKMTRRRHRYASRATFTLSGPTMEMVPACVGGRVSRRGYDAL